MIILRLYYWKPTNNFGDMLSPVVLQYVSGQRVCYAERNATGKFLAVGSVLRALRERDVVWGSGSIVNQPIRPPAGVRFLAVRGPLTRKLIQGDCPEIYGDPALIIPEVFPQTRGSAYKIGLLPHEVDRKFMPDPGDSHVLWIDICSGVKAVIRQMVKCELIISSSLHGVLVAEAYGIPAVWVRCGDRLIGGNHKFHDYLLSTGREPIAPQAWPQKLSVLAKNPLPAPGPFDTKPLKAALRRYLKERAK